MPMMGWRESRQNNVVGKTLIINQSNEDNANPRFARITVNAGGYSLSNEGFRGIGIHKGTAYTFRYRTRRLEGSVKMKLELVNASGKVINGVMLPNAHEQWQDLSATFTTTDTLQRGKLVLHFEGKGTIDIDQVSLFPNETWKNRERGLRKDLVELLAGLQPGFLRFPGGCIVEGRDLTNRYQWKNTIGTPEQRKLLMNRWNVEFPRKNAPDYYQSFKLGFFEYFQLAEDIGAAPLPIINCGMACQYNSGEVTAMNELDPFIQDALDLVEFANGDKTTKWGSIRAAMGHEQPFNLQYIGIGNEQWDEQYVERYKEFEKVLLSKYPSIKLVAAAGPSPDGPRFEYAWKEFRQLQAALIDEHYYQSPDWFFKNASRYDNYDRKGPKVFAGEYAAHGKEEAAAESRNTWLSALAEAAFMTGLERNADIVQMSSYAPLLAHVDAWQWRPDLIWFNNLAAVATPNYYVQQLFSTNRGTDVIPILSNGQIISGKDSLYASAAIDKEKKQVIVKLVNASSQQKDFVLQLDGIKSASKEAAIKEMSAANLLDYNSIESPGKVKPVEKKITVAKKKITLPAKPFSFAVIKIDYTL
jgi:alpha-N-arabinofuranosidase